MALDYTVSIHVSRAVAEVFDAVADPDKLSRYFITGGAEGRLETGAVVTWDFHDFPGAFPVDVIEVILNEEIILRWQAHDTGATKHYALTVTMRFQPTGEGRTSVEVTEAGWQDTPTGRKGSYGNCMGWSQMLAALKAWVEYGIKLREGAYS